MDDMQKWRRFKIDKLIRDKMPEIMRSMGLMVDERTVDVDEYISLLKLKLVEEATEVFNAKSLEEITEELADVCEVLLSLCKAQNIDFEAVEKARINKKEHKGGFDKRTYNKCVEIEANNPFIKYYLNNKEAYPEEV
ncbi:MAG: nucleoside triphosphate pyrophosphohydrolase [Sphingobacteriia bacterium]|nr:nucleoside triphosphate pyrophosphohydrolase [Sphingobacteriia bacterium]